MSNHLFQQTDSLAWNEFEDVGFVISFGEDKEMHQLNSTGTFLWRKLETPQSLEQLTLALSTTFDVSYEQAEKDVSTFLADLQARQLIKDCVQREPTLAP